MIELCDVTFSYDKQTVLDGLSLHVDRDQRIGILGESGCGKSTLLKLIAGLFRPSSGILTVDGESEPGRIIGKVAMVMQTSMLLPLTIHENVTMGHDYAREWVESVCEAANLGKWIRELPDGMQTYLGDRADELSGGQAQRIAIARAMCKNAPVLLLDEPTSALDQENADAVLESLERYGEGRCVIHVTHKPEHLRGYDHVYLLEAGKLREVTANGERKEWE